MLRQALMGLSRAATVKDLATRMPVSSAMVARFVAGEDTADAVRVARTLRDRGLAASIAYLGEDVTDPASADEATTAYLTLLDALWSARLTDTTEVSVKLSAIGQQLGDRHPELAASNARVICTAAQVCGTTVTLDMEDHTTTDATLDTLAELRRDHPTTGVAIQAQLHRSVDDCARLATPGSRVRLCKGAYAEPDEIAHTERHEVDLAFVRCLKVLMQGEGYPMVATHDPRLIRISLDIARQSGRGPDDFEFQMLYGVRPEEQQRLADQGHRVRVYVPYGADWYRYLVRRMAEKPANLGLFVRSLTSRS